MRRKKRRVPVVLWRIFGDKARTLRTTIASIIPSQSDGSDSATSLLVQPRDPPDYIQLLNHSFVVLDPKSPPFTQFHPRRNNWPQNEIVIRSIEMMMRDKSTAANVLCCAYDKCNRSSHIVELLTSSAWNLLLKRVGDDVMVYLLKHASIFLPLAPNKHCQVAGPHVASSALAIQPKKKRPTQPLFHDPSVVNFGQMKKRDSVDNANSTSDVQQQRCLHVNGCIGCVNCNGSYIKRHPIDKNGQTSVSQAAAPTAQIDSTEHEEIVNLRKHSRPFRWRHCKKRKSKHSDINECSGTPIDSHPADKCCHMSVSESASPTTGVCTVNDKGLPVEKLEGLNQVILKAEPKKHSRHFRWQRYKKRRRIDAEEDNDKTSYSMDCTDEDPPLARPQYDLNNVESQFHDKMPQQCSCCLVFQDAHLVTKGAEINRQPIFYNLEQSSLVLPRKHVLNFLKPNFTCSKSLTGTIFGLSNVNANAPSELCSHSSAFCHIGSACLYHSLVKFLKILILRNHCCNPLRLLNKHCMVSSSTQIDNQNLSSIVEENYSERKVPKKSGSVNNEHCKSTISSGGPQTEAIKPYCSKSQVVSFVWAVCRNLVPPDLLGASSNWRILRRNISKFIQLRRFEKFSIRQCMHKLKTSGFPFLSDKHSLCCLEAKVLKKVPRKKLETHKSQGKLNYAASSLNYSVSTFKHMLLEKWIFWFFSCLVVPLLQANFYITESEHGKQDIFYYLKPIWERLKNSTIADLKDQNYQNYQQLDPSDVKSIIGNRLFGFSKLRLRPKENGTRMLANLKAPSRMLFQEFSSAGIPGKAQFCSKLNKYRYFKPVNSVLRDTYAVLKGILWKEPEKLGSSVFDYNDIHRKLCPFIIGLKNGLSTIPNVYIVVSDVSKAFDSVDQDQLLSVMKDILHNDEYFLQQSSQVVCTKKSLWVHENFMLADLDIGTGFIKRPKSFSSLHTVLVNQGFGRYMKKKEIFSNLYEHVKRNVLQFDKTFYLQGIGIPQGSILSSLLCSVYYGHLERNVLFPFIENTCGPTAEDVSERCNSRDASAAAHSTEDRVVSPPCHILFRLIDDLCFISTSKKQAECFYTRLHTGFQDYNCYMNKEKFCLSFYSGHEPVLSSNRVYTGEDGVSFIRWSGLLLNSCTLEVQADYTRYVNNHLKSALTVYWQENPGHRLRAKLCAFMRPKCHPIFFDSNINSGPVVRLNIYQAFLLCAMKFHCYVSEMYMCKLQPRFHLKIIKKSIRYMYALIKKMTRPKCTGSHLHPIIQLAVGEVEWLGLDAFIRVLKRKQSRHKELLHLLKSKLLAHKLNGNVPSELRYAVDSSHSSVMWKIKY